MKKVLIGLITVVLLAGLGFVLYTQFGERFKSHPPGYIASDTKSYKLDEMLQLYKDGAQKRCEYKGTTQAGVTYTVAVSFSKGRAFTGIEQGEVPSFSLYKDATLYTWRADTATGTKTTMTQTAYADTLAKTVTQNSTADAGSVTVTCSTWTPNESFFIVPSAITF